MNQQDSGVTYDLELYIAGRTPTSSLAIANFESLCREHLGGRHTAEVIDILKNPQRAKIAQIVATPTFVVETPPPFRKIIGTLSKKPHTPCRT